MVILGMWYNEPLSGHVGWGENVERLNDLKLPCWWPTLPTHTQSTPPRVRKCESSLGTIFILHTYSESLKGFEIVQGK